MRSAKKIKKGTFFRIRIVSDHHIWALRVYGHTHTNQNQSNQQIDLVLHSPHTLPTSSTHHKNHNHKQQLNNFLKKPHQCMSSMHEFHWSIATTNLNDSMWVSPTH